LEKLSRIGNFKYIKFNKGQKAGLIQK
jgi:hypothetical protein